MTDIVFDRHGARVFRFLRCEFAADTGEARLLYAFDDGPGGRVAIGQEKALPVVNVDSLGTSTAGDEQVGRGVEDQVAELSGELVNGYPLLSEPGFTHG